MGKHIYKKSSCNEILEARREARTLLEEGVRVTIDVEFLKWAIENGINRECAVKRLLDIMRNGDSEEARTRAARALYALKEDEKDEIKGAIIKW